MVFSISPTSFIILLVYLLSMVSFEANVSKMGRKRMINVPARRKEFKVGNKIKVLKQEKTQRSENE